MGQFVSDCTAASLERGRGPEPMARELCLDASPKSVLKVVVP